MCRAIEDFVSKQVQARVQAGRHMHLNNPLGDFPLRLFFQWVNPGMNESLVFEEHVEFLSQFKEGSG